MVRVLTILWCKFLQFSGGHFDNYVGEVCVLNYWFSLRGAFAPRRIDFGFWRLGFDRQSYALVLGPLQVALFSFWFFGLWTNFVAAAMMLLR